MDFAQISREVFDQEIGELMWVSHSIGPEIDKVVNLIYNCTGKVVVTGIGKTGLIGKKIAASLASTGTPAIFMNATDAVHETEPGWPSAWRSGCRHNHNGTS